VGEREQQKRHGGGQRLLPSMRLHGLIDLDEFMTMFEASAGAGGAGEGEGGGCLTPGCPLPCPWRVAPTHSHTHTHTHTRTESGGTLSPGLRCRNTEDQ